MNKVLLFMLAISLIVNVNKPLKDTEMSEKDMANTESFILMDDSLVDFSDISKIMKANESVGSDSLWAIKFISSDFNEFGVLEYEITKDSEVLNAYLSLDMNEVFITDYNVLQRIGKCGIKVLPKLAFDAERTALVKDKYISEAMVDKVIKTVEERDPVKYAELFESLQIEGYYSVPMDDLYKACCSELTEEEYEKLYKICAEDIMDYKSYKIVELCLYDSYGNPLDIGSYTELISYVKAKLNL